jgi:hypothetical protein
MRRAGHFRGVGLSSSLTRAVVSSSAAAIKRLTHRPCRKPAPPPSGIIGVISSQGGAVDQQCRRQDEPQAYDVKGHSSGRKTFHHPRVGDVAFGYQSMTLEGTAGHRLIAYHAPPGTPEYDTMLLLDAAGKAAERSARRTGAGRPAAGRRPFPQVPFG